MSATTKKCTKCGESKPATREFFRFNRLGKNGLSAECAECLRARGRDYNRRHRDRLQAMNREYRAARPEWVKETKRGHYQRHKERIKERTRRHRLLHGRAQQSAESKKRADEKKRRLRKGAFSPTLRRKYADVVTEQSGKCFWCLSDLTTWHLDHIIPVVRGGSHDRGNVCCACPDCNLQKGHKTPSEWFAEPSCRAAKSVVEDYLCGRVDRLRSTPKSGRS